MNHSRGGFTLFETLAAIAIIAILSVGIGAGINSGLRVYRDSAFQNDSGILSDILNTAMEDILQYSCNIKENSGTFQDSQGNILTQEEAGFVFTNYEYGVRSGYLCTEPSSEEAPGGILLIKNLNSPAETELVNSGAYGGLRIRGLKIQYFPENTPIDGESSRGNFFTVFYEIYDVRSPRRVRNVSAVIRILNPV